jgi:adenylate kinase
MGDVILLLGPPNAGKKTQAIQLALYLFGVHIASGDLMRDGKEPHVAEIMAGGDLIDPSDFIRIIEPAIKAVPPTAPIILEGASRRPEEVKLLLDLIEEVGRRLRFVIVLNIDKELSFARSQVRWNGAERRRDDDPRVQARRWERWMNDTHRSIERYVEAGHQVFWIDCTPEMSEDDVANKIKEAMSPT